MILTASDTVRPDEHAARFCFAEFSRKEMKKGLVRGFSDCRVPSYFLLKTTAAPRAARTARTGAGEAGSSGCSGVSGVSVGRSAAGSSA